MSDAVTAAIEASVAAASGGGDDVVADPGGAEDTSGVETTHDVADVVDAGDGAVADPVADPVDADDPVVAAADKPVEKVKEPDEIDKLLEAEGIKLTTDKSGRENRLPHSRTKRIILNALTKERATHATALTERDTRLAAADTELTAYRQAEQLATQDPDRYILTLAAHNPAYAKFVKGGTVAAPVVAGAKFDKPRPQPNVTLPDGSLTYDDKGLEALTEWIAEKAAFDTTARVTADFNKRLDPFENRLRRDAADAALRPKIAAQVSEAEKLWGQPFKDDYAKGKDSEILKYMTAHKDVPFDACIAAVLVPKIRADRTTMRSEVMNEMKKRPKAAERAPAAAAAGSADDGAPKSIEDVIRQSIRSLPGR